MVSCGCQAHPLLSRRSQWSSGQCARLRCDRRTQVQISPRTVVFITTTTVIYSTQLNSTQLNRELRTQVSDTSKSAS